MPERSAEGRRGEISEVSIAEMAWVAIIRLVKGRDGQGTGGRCDCRVGGTVAVVLHVGASLGA